MKKKLFFWIGSLTAVSFLVSACQSQPSPVNSQEIQNATETQEEVKVLSKGEETRLLVLDKLQPGMTEEEIRRIFGGEFALVENAMQGNETWRYDIGKSSDYQFDDQGIDRVDLEGLKTKSVEALLFIDWTDQGIVDAAALYVYNEQDKETFYEYHIDASGVEEITRSFN